LTAAATTAGPPPPPPPSVQLPAEANTSGRSSLLEDIRKGKQLKSAKRGRNRKKERKAENESAAAEPTGDIMASLRQALMRRNMSISGNNPGADKKKGKKKKKGCVHRNTMIFPLVAFTNLNLSLISIPSETILFQCQRLRLRLLKVGMKDRKKKAGLTKYIELIPNSSFFLCIMCFL
jgi:hypothetical protein